MKKLLLFSLILSATVISGVPVVPKKQTKSEKTKPEDQTRQTIIDQAKNWYESYFEPLSKEDKQEILKAFDAAHEIINYGRNFFKTPEKQITDFKDKFLPNDAQRAAYAATNLLNPLKIDLNEYKLYKFDQLSDELYKLVIFRSYTSSMDLLQGLMDARKDQDRKIILKTLQELASVLKLMKNREEANQKKYDAMDKNKPEEEKQRKIVEQKDKTIEKYLSTLTQDKQKFIADIKKIDGKNRYNDVNPIDIALQTVNDKIKSSESLSLK